MEHSAAREPYRTGELAFTDEEIDKLLAACSSLEDELMLMVAVSLGLRRKDLVNVKNKDIDLDAPVLAYYEHKKRRVRIVTLGPKLTQKIRQYLNAQDPKQRRREFLFPFKERTAYNRLQVLCEHAGIPYRPFHALRATCVKRAARRGWTVEQTARLIGDSVRVVQMHYATPSNQEMAEKVKEAELI